MCRWIGNFSGGGFSLNVVLPVRQNYNMLEGNRIENMAEKQAQDEVA